MKEYSERLHINLSLLMVQIFITSLSIMIVNFGFVKEGIFMFIFGYTIIVIPALWFLRDVF